jgi:hypothetical protein
LCDTGEAGFDRVQISLSVLTGPIYLTRGRFIA